MSRSACSDEASIRISRSLARHLLIGGASLGLLGGLVLVWGSIVVLRAMRSKNGVQRPHRIREKASILVGFFLVAAGLFSQTLAQLARSVGR